jgi:1-deoxy-D-xylulose-5-phosphate synthase
MDIAGKYPLLRTIGDPDDLRKLPEAKLGDLVGELRDFTIRSVAASGGHFAAGLGAVELTVALHYIFDTPNDRLVWDVGHQTYPHKALTARRDRLHSIRQRGGLSGFPRRSESRYDTFGVAHAGTAISAALGMTLAADDRRVVAVVGDGALTAGMALEALSHAGALGADMLVIINDNGMSISPNVGALSRHLRGLRSRPHRAKPNGARETAESPASQAMEEPPTLFEQLGFAYFGPVDGHDLHALLGALRELRPQRGPRVLHVVTSKGQGYAPAEADPVRYHGVTPFDPELGLRPSRDKRGSTAPTYTEVFGDWLCDMAAADRRLMGITPAMREGSGLTRFAERYPKRYFDTAIAEQHAVTLAAGMACEGLKPVVAIYSTFLQRAYDQLIHDVAIQNLDVLFAIDRGGLVGADGPTHAGAFDLSYLRCIPNLVVMAPADENECRQMLYTGFTHEGPTAVRYPRTAAAGVRIRAEMQPLPIGRAELRRRGRDVAILAFGTLLGEALTAGEQLNATVVNMRFVKPLDRTMVRELAATHRLLVTLEDNVVAGGAGSAVTELLNADNRQVPVINLGLPDAFVEHGSRSELLSECGLDAPGILKAVEQQLRQMRALNPHPDTLQDRLLAGVSRTFALTIPQLPPSLRHVVSNAYLLCRIVDTIEDEPALNPLQKRAFCSRFARVVSDGVSAADLAADLAPLLSERTIPAEHQLIREMPAVLEITRSLGPRQQRAIARCIRIMASGMAEFQASAGTRGLANLSNMDRYCYVVAGVVGEMLTDLFCDHSPAIEANRNGLQRLAVSFGQGLQMTNILKDVWEDRSRGACWLPRDLFAERGFDLSDLGARPYQLAFEEGLGDLVGVALGHLKNALEYTLLIPREETGIRNFCLWAVGMAALTLRRVNAHRDFRAGSQVKISRRAVKLTVATLRLNVANDRMLRALFYLVSQGLPKPPASEGGEIANPAAPPEYRKQA